MSRTAKRGNFTTGTSKDVLTAANVVSEMAAFDVATEHTRACLLELKRDTAHVVPFVNPYALVAPSTETRLDDSKDGDINVHDFTDKVMKITLKTLRTHWRYLKHHKLS